MINHIELAKECGLPIELGYGDKVVYFHDQLAAFTNAIIERCALVAEEYDAGYGSEHRIRDLKVEE